ncbi:Uncharacterized protein SCG7086_CO_00030 [Chlamydiales bacterium SCGC AG-110-P3]|nr:Uncharacterized protein SCG7086_CO_00030 [Chlamydiales bacterium SCGC AG-110-P3]
MIRQKEVVKDFQRIPGVGKSIAQDLWDMGFRSVSELENGNPDALYQGLCDLKGCQVDRCMLYVFRCAVYFASESSPDPELLKWWNWKD